MTDERRVDPWGKRASVARYTIDLFLTETDATLTLYLRNSARLRNIEPNRVRVIEGDVRDTAKLKEAMAGQDVVYANLVGDLEQLAKRTGHLRRFVVFGSHVTDKEAPNDVDVILVMDDGFALVEAALETPGLFHHAVAGARYSASIFWLKPSVLIGEKLEDFLTYWQTKRDGSLRGIVEIAT